MYFIVLVKLLTQSYTTSDRVTVGFNSYDVLTNIQAFLAFLEVGILQFCKWNVKSRKTQGTINKLLLLFLFLLLLLKRMFETWRQLNAVTLKS